VPRLPLHPSLLRLVSVADEARARMWQTGGRYVAQVLDVPAYIEVTGISKRECVAELRRITGDDVALTIELVPDVVVAS
jgi:hypothetical protein